MAVNVPADQSSAIWSCCLENCVFNPQWPRNPPDRARNRHHVLDSGASGYERSLERGKSCRQKAVSIQKTV